MWIIKKTAFLNFYSIHPEAKDRLLTFYRTLKNCSAVDFNELKMTFGTVDYVPPTFTVFDVGGNAYRVIAVIHYNSQKAYIREIFTHSEYDKWTRKNRGK
jgi:mRNA interferase HigB